MSSPTRRGIRATDHDGWPRSGHRVERFPVRCPTCGAQGRLVVAYADAGGPPTLRQYRCVNQMLNRHVLPSDAQLKAALPLVFGSRRP